MKLGLYHMVKQVHKRRRVAGAPIIMHSKGEETDSTVFEEITKRPGSSVREIAERVGWTNGRIDGSINRLVSQGRVKVKHYLRRGLLLKKVYPSEHIPEPRDVVAIPKDMIGEDLCKEKAFIYALSRSAIGISPQNIEEWDKKALLKEEIPLLRKDESIVIKLPDSLSRFYQMENSETSLSTLGNLALLTIEPILPVALPSTYPEEFAVKMPTRLMWEARIEKVTSFSSIALISMDMLREEAKRIQVPFTVPQYMIPPSGPSVSEGSSGKSETFINQIYVEAK